DTAQNYVNSLSRALRYTLKSNEKQLVTLKEEMEFMESYLFLIRMRFGSNLTVQTTINENLLSYNLPPLTIQTLVENAIKHNEISKLHPLTISILTTEYESLIIANGFQKKITSEEGTGIGLINLSKQFQLIVNKEIIIRNENNMFSVEVPLIRQ
ncbi:MAG TPA: histidine kinase, partial [Bacteroidales bacterium]|nr:histidine kinase [Bacteroidales bacterium]